MKISTYSVKLGKLNGELFFCFTFSVAEVSSMGLEGQPSWLGTGQLES